MKHAIPFAILGFLLILVTYVILQPLAAEEDGNIPAEPNSPAVVCAPDFQDYPASSTEDFTQAEEIDFSSNEDAKNFQAKITEAFEAGPNFAGHYTLADWGCGTSCASAAVVNNETGVIIAYGIEATAGYDFSTSSRLLIVNPKTNLPNDPNLIYQGLKTYYFELKDDKLKFVCEAQAYPDSMRKNNQ